MCPFDRTYDPNGNVLSTSNALGGVTSSAYDRDGNVTMSSSPAGGTILSYYDENDDVVTSVSALGATTTISYDLNGDMTESVSPQGVTTNTYNTSGELTLSVSPLSGSTRNTYDLSGLLTSSVDPIGHTSLFSYDHNGDVTSTVDATGTTLTGYDQAGEVTSVTAPTGASSTGYDGAGDVTLSYTSATGSTVNDYDKAGDVTKSINGDSQTSLSYYDNNGDLTQYVDPSNTTTTYRYDLAGRATQTITPLGTTLTSYDGDNNVTRVVDADGRTTSMSYDSGDRLLSNATGSFGYNAEGDVTSASNANGSYSSQYNTLGQVTSASEPFGVSLNFAYDDAGNRTQVTDSLGGSESLTYDLDDRLTTLTYSGQSQSLSETLGYYPGGEVSTAMLYSGATLIASEAYGIGSNDQVTSIQDKYASGSTMALYDYSYNGNVQLTQAIANGATTNYAYDTGGELTSAGSASYSYGANGNPTNLANTDLTGTDNELTQFVDPNTGDTWTYSYDQVGNRTQAIDAGASLTTTWKYAYDNADHMTAATETIGGTAVQTSGYEYDAFGNLLQETVVKSGSTAISRYAVDGWNPANAGNLGTSAFTDWAILDGTNSNALITREIMSVGTQSGQQTTPLVRIDEAGAQDGGGVFWTETARLGSVSNVLNNTANAAAVDQVEYDAYGNIISQTPGGSMYLGLYSWDSYNYDAATALNNNDARVYDPVSQRWMSQDPLGYDAGDSNLYRYVNNAPTGGTDPSGLQDTPLGRFAEAIVDQVNGKDVTPNSVTPIPIKKGALAVSGGWSPIPPNTTNNVSLKQIAVLAIPVINKAAFGRRPDFQPDPNQRIIIGRAVPMGGGNLAYTGDLGHLPPGTYNIVFVITIRVAGDLSVRAGKSPPVFIRVPR